MSSAFPTRRRFLTAAARAAGAMVLAGWNSSLLAAPDEPARGENDLIVIDSHTHFYDPSRAKGVPWPPQDDKLLYRTVLPRNYRTLPVPKPVAGTVVVEASPWLEDNQWILGLAAQNPIIAGFVGNLPIGTKAFAGHLKRFAANELFRGIRLRDRKLDGGTDDPAFISDLKLLASTGLSLDLVGGMEILPFADRLAREAPGLRIIIDHLAGVIIDGRPPPQDWSRQMQALARRTAVFCKVSGLVEGTGRTDGSAPRDVEFYRPVLDAMRQMFGPERLIYASNWPVSERFAPLSTVEAIPLDYFRSHGRAAEEAVFCKTAQTAYNLPRRKRP